MRRLVGLGCMCDEPGIMNSWTQLDLSRWSDLCVFLVVAPLENQVFGRVLVG